ncbi:hypothetical protein CRENBAI_019603 [Crenichthys baileyi]|uniref:Ig-like domain-containing protein n=1 Tax=Crenichthys baileyi TaxID=28760 RepID=A0AAV9RWZ3_9TELE
MFSCSIFLGISLLNILRGFYVSACDFSCEDKPVLTPSRLVVKFGDPTSATCVACQKDCLPLEESVIDMEASRGKTTSNGTTVTWKVDHLREWELTPKCFYTDKNDKQCCTNLIVTVYKPPERVIMRLDEAGPLTEGTEYTLQCSVQDVAPARNLIVAFYRGLTQLGHMKSTSTTKAPVSETFSLSYNTSKEDNGAHFWCEAKLELGAEGPKPPPVVKSNDLSVTVHYGPELKVPADPAPINIISGKTLQLNCSAEGNPDPLYNWTLPSNKGHHSEKTLTVESVDFQDGGQYVCTVSNKVSTVSVRFNVTVQKNTLLYIIAAVVAAVALFFIGAAVFYTFYYKQNKMGKYRLKEVFRLGTVHHTAVPLVLLVPGSIRFLGLIAALGGNDPQQWLTESLSALGVYFELRKLLDVWLILAFNSELGYSQKQKAGRSGKISILYSVWDYIYVSDDEDVACPFVDTPSLFRMRHPVNRDTCSSCKIWSPNPVPQKARLEKTAEFQQRGEYLEHNFAEWQRLVQEAQRRLGHLEERMKEGGEDEEREAELEKVQAECLNIQPEIKKENHQQKVKKHKTFVEKYAKEIKHFGMLQPEVSVQQPTSGINKEQIAHQALVMQFVLDLARTLKIDPRGCFRRFFSKIKTADKPYQDVFNRELDLLKEQDRRCVRARMEGTMKELEEEERQKRVGPGGLDPLEVYESLPNEMQRSFDEKNIEMLQDVTDKLDPVVSWCLFQKYFF